MISKEEIRWILDQGYEGLVHVGQEHEERGSLDSEDYYSDVFVAKKAGRPVQFVMKTTLKPRRPVSRLIVDEEPLANADYKRALAEHPVLDAPEGAIRDLPDRSKS